ncbi:MAG: preprotein translocase subunit SecG [Acidobacteria bacterium]|nr:preprotein translocase subunit SecG [Acidobacteriota bacterium]
MMALLVSVHVLTCVFLIIVVLLQSGKAADLAGAFGGMGSQTAFGPRGAATVLSKATTGAAVLFMITSITLSIVATRRGSTVGGGSSVLDRQKTSPTTPIQTVPAPKPSVATEPSSGQPADVQYKTVSPEEMEKALKKNAEHPPAEGHAPAPGHSAPAAGHSAPAAPAKK